MAVNDPLIGQRLGGCEIVDLIGRGGMGQVYRARDEGRGHDIALKLLNLDHLEDLREIQRFQREAALAAKLDHPNIVSIYGSGRDRGFLYLAMELVEGESLRRLLRGQGRLSLDQALAIAVQVFQALEAAHEHHIVHRDIKADNIIVQEDGMAKVLDFGVAKMEGGTVLTRADEILGTVEYMAPEQILGDPIGPAADLYAAGVLLYEMLTGSLPFTGDSPATLVYHQLNEEPRAPSFLNPAVPRSADRLVLKLLDKLPENRYPSAGAAFNALAEIRRRHQMFAVPGLDRVESEEAEAEEEIRTRDFRPRFVGRQAEMEALGGYFDGLDRGGRVIFLPGEAGVGKTRLAEEIGRVAEERGGRTIWGACFYEQGMGSYMPFLDALGYLFNKAENGLSDQEREELGRLLEQEAPELADLAVHSSTTARVRAGFAAAFGTEEDTRTARQRLFDTIANLLSAVAEARPLVVILEDMHWADEAALQLLQYLGRRAAETQLLFLVTYRPEELAEEEPGSGPFSRMLRQLDTENLLREVPLERLGSDEVRQLAGSLFLEAEFSQDFVEYLYTQSQGNPFIAVEIMKMLRHQDVLYCESGIWSVRVDFAEVQIPDRVNALIMQRVDQLDLELRELLQIAAVIGQNFTSRVLEAGAGLSRIALLKALFRLEKRYRLIVSVKGGYEFSHSKIREVLYEEIPWELRCEYHRMVAAILEEQGEQGQAVEDAQLGYHLYQAEEFERAVPYLSRVGDEVYRLFNWRSASLLFDQLVEACQRSDGPAEVLLRALKLGGRSCAQSTLYEKAQEKFEAMRQLAAQAGRPEDEADAWKQQAMVYKRQRRFSDAVRCYERALDCLVPLGADNTRLAWGRIMLNWGMVDFEEGRYTVAEDRWQGALSALGEFAPEEVAHPLNNLAVLATVRGRLDEAWERYEQVLEMVGTDAPSAQVMLAYYNMGMVRADQERWDEALELYAQSLEICQQVRSVFYRPAIELNRSEALLGKGDLGEAREACSRALRGFRHLDDALGVADALRLYGRLCRLERNWEDGRAYLEKSIELNRQFGETVSLGEALYELGVLNRDAGQAAAALEPLQDAEKIFVQAEASLDLDRVRTVLEELEAA